MNAAMVLLPVCGKRAELGCRVTFVDQNVAAPRLFDQFIGWGGVTGDDNGTVRGREFIAVGFETAVLGAEGCEGQALIGINLACRDLRDLDT